MTGAGEPGTLMKSVPLGAFQPLEEKSGMELVLCAMAPATRAAKAIMAVPKARHRVVDADLDTGSLLPWSLHALVAETIALHLGVL